ncbi:MAG: NgoPII family restriction endonuclease [Candidatus Omnitrophota bacterium]|nr:NgoPII family restriction endonuclease [Candidatus Omnitrophota bacterium]
MNTNILRAAINLSKMKDNNIMDIYKSNTRINNVGDALEYYVRDIFCGMAKGSIANKEKAYAENFSYLGNQNNPPDFIIKNGDAVEVKKIGTLKSAIALNSSYPKEKLLLGDGFITEACRQCEQWEEKDYIYSVGSVINKKLKLLWLVYGDCYAANKNTYERILKAIKNGVKQINGIQFSETREIGKVKKVDPLGITVLRIRGMWHIDNPIRAFDYVAKYDPEKEFTMFAIMKKSKYLSFPKKDREEMESSGISISDTKIKDPNNPVNRIDAKLIKVVF